MSWLTSTNTGGVVKEDNDWLDNDDDTPSSFDPIESLRLKFMTLGENEGLEEGMKNGERKGYEAGYSMESLKAFYLGRIIGCCKVVVLQTKNLSVKSELNKKLSELEEIAKLHWVSNPSLVNEHMTQVRLELARLGVSIPEWKDGEKD